MSAAAIAQHLSITESAIIKIEEWVNVLFVVCRRIGVRFVSKKVVEEKQMTKPILKSEKRKSIFDNNDVILKPQNQFSSDLKSQISKQLTKWLVEFDYPAYHAGLLANHLCQLAIDKRIEKTSPLAANVLFTDKDKVEQVVFEAKKIAQQFERENKIDETIERLERLDSEGEGNSL